MSRIVALPILQICASFAASLTISLAYGESSQVTIVSAVTNEPGLPDLGGIASLYVSGLLVTGVVVANGAPLPLSLAGVAVDVCGAPAPLYAVADRAGYQQVNFQVPWEASFTFEGSNTRCVVSVKQGSFQAIQNAYVRTFSGGDLFFTPDYIGVFQHGSDYSRVTRNRGAQPGEALIIYAAALPRRTVPPVATGVAAPFSPLAVLPHILSCSDFRVTLYIDDSEVEPFFVGLSPGLVGVYQLNFIVPVGTSNGDHIMRVIDEWGYFHGLCFPPTLWKGSNPVILPVGVH